MPRRRTPVTRHDIASIRSPSEPRSSPDGRFVVYVETHNDLDRNTRFQNLCLVDVENGRERRLRRGRHRDTSPRWLPDSRRIVFVSDHGGCTNLWILDLDASAQALTDLAGEVESPCVSPDGTRVAFLFTAHRAEDSPPRPRRTRRLGYKYDGDGFRDGARTHLWCLDLRTRRRRPLTSGDFDVASPTWSPDGRSLAFVSNRIPRADVLSQNSDIFVVAASGGRVRQLTRKRGPKSAPSWSPDGTRIAYFGHTGFPDAVENTHVWAVGLRGGAARDLMPDADLFCKDRLIGDTRDVTEDTSPPVWSRDGARIAFLATREGATNIWEVPSRGGRPQQRSHGAHHIPEFAGSLDGRHWVFVCITPTSPGEVFLASASREADAGGASPTVSGARVRRLTRLHDLWRAGRVLPEPREFRIACVGGHHLHGWMLRAGGRSRRRRPAIVMLHGGPYAAYGWSFSLEFHVLAALGYDVVFANPRGSVGYGRTFMRALVGKWGTIDYEDLIRLADTLERTPGVDPKRIAIAGGSYGGYLANWTVAHTRRFRCAVSMRGISNLVSLFGTSDIGVRFTREFEAQAPWESIERYWRASPLAHVQNVETPLLLLHPEEDQRCPVSQSEEMFAALRWLDRDVELVRFPGESHAMSRSGRPQSRVERLRILADWFARRL